MFVPTERPTTATPPETPSDDALMALVQEGDRVAFARLVERHHARVWAVAWRYAGSAALAQDLVQDAFLKLWETAPRYRADGRFGGYLLRLLVNRALNLKRSAGREITGEIPESSTERRFESPSAMDPEERLESARRRNLVQEAMRSLPDSQRMALALRYQEEMSYEEIARVMETSVKAVERLMARGREGMRARLAHLSTST
ncbi:MAG: sigma-70 family RNA polymerase sigma factor [Deltaproteobacteria bacterium]|nr:sigma-70 family RNA polymerase sigma factor [Deltaproteobacteria bacterium]